MMSREEWLDYFETVNGRKPSEEEAAQALAAGDFVDVLDAKEVSGQPDSVALDNQKQSVQASPATPLANQASFGQVQPGFTGAVPTYTMPAPQRKKKIILIVGIIVGALLLIGVSVGGVITYRYVSGAVPEGTYTSSELDDNLRDVLDDVDTYTLVNGTVSDATLEMAVSDDHVVKISMSYKVDWDTYWKNYLEDVKDSYKSTYGRLGLSDSTIEDYVDSRYSSYESTYQSEFNSNLTDAVKIAGGMYDKDTGEISFNILTGKINQFNHTITVNSINLDFLDAKSSDDYSSDYLSAVFADEINDSFDDISEGQEIDYTVSGSSLSFNGMSFQK